MLAVHRTLAVVLVLLALGATLWAARSAVRRQVPSRLLKLTLAVSALLGVQALLGVVLAIEGGRPQDGATHFVVGPLTLLVLPVTRRVVGDREDRAAATSLAVAWGVLLILSLRAVGSGGSVSG